MVDTYVFGLFPAALVLGGMLAVVPSTFDGVASLGLSPSSVWLERRKRDLQVTGNGML